MHGFVSASLACSLATAFACTFAAGAGSAPIKRSDVVFMGNKGVEVTKAYGGTVISWGGRPWGDNKKALDGFAQRTQAVRALGVRLLPAAAFRTAFAGMIDFDPNFMDSVCRTFDGKPILVPWLWDHKHKGHPAYWFCTNAPGYRAYLKHQVKLCMSTPVDGLHIDDYNGTAGTEWRGGCFCRYCMAAFREYLKANVPAARLQECGVESLDGFDYGKWLKRKGFTQKDYRYRVNSTLPLGPEFMKFQYQASAAWVGEVRQYAEGLQGKPLMLSVNSSASSDKSLVIAPQLTFFCGEVHHGGDKGGMPAAYAIWNFKLADAVGKRQVSTGSGGDWAYIAQYKKPGLVRTWIAQDYAFGHQLMCPHRQWAYTKTKGSHHYQSKPEDYAHIYRWIRRNAALFDGYEAAANVALVYRINAAGPQRTGAQEACYWLAGHNVPFHVLLAGRGLVDFTLKPEQLAKYGAIIVCAPTRLDGASKAALDAAAKQGKLVQWNAAAKAMDAAKLGDLVPGQITIAGAASIMAVPRVRADGSAVVHLLNRNYDKNKDAIATQTNVTVVLDKSLFNGRTFSKATFHTPPAKLDPAAPGQGEATPLSVKTDAQFTTVRVPALGLWGIVELRGGSPDTQ